MNKDYLEKLALLAVRKGVNVQPGQTVVLSAGIEAADLARLVVKEAYKAGAREVIVNWYDDETDHETYLNADEEIFKTAPAWKVRQVEDTAAEDACYIRIIGSDPDLLKDVDPNRVQSRNLAMNKATPTYRSKLNNGTLAWTIVAAPTKAWAKKVFPDLSEEEAVEALWKDIFHVSRVDDNDAVENWNKHENEIRTIVEKLNKADLKKLHYTSENGTDLWVELPEGYKFEGGNSTLQNGLTIDCNIPTEEVFTAPSKYGVNGTLNASMPLNHNGILIDDFGFEFKDGKVTDFHAGKGKEALELLLNADEGSSYLGEVALVPFDSPIRDLDRIFFNTLIDENAACHFALGQSYAETIENGQNLSKDELLEKGMNQSDIHVDFMVGTRDLKIDGFDGNGNRIPVFENGNFSTWFDD